MKKASIRLVQQIQRLFAFLIRSHRKYLDPTMVLTALVDDFGNPIHIGDEKDVGEFNMILISRIEDGLKVGQADAMNIDTFSLKRKDSFTPLQESILLDEGIVTTLFYGKQTEELNFREQSGEDVNMKVNAIFGQIMLDVEERDLYYAWDSACHSTIDEFITPQNYRTSAKQDVWLERLPAILLVQINRVKFDRATGKPVKLHSKFTYPKVLYPDRFLIQNKGLSTTLRTQELELKRKVKILETHLAQFEQFKDSQMPLEEVLKLTSAFLEDQMSSSDFMQIDDEDLEIETFNIGKVEIQVPDLPSKLTSAKELLDAYLRSVTVKVSEMKDQLRTVMEEIDRIYRRPELQQHEYHLHSLLIHDGQAGSGHYYAYSYDEDEEKWWKFNDIHVTEATEEDVQRDSVGGYSYTSAYCLVYLDQRLLRRQEGVKLRSYSLASIDVEPTDQYSSYLTRELLKEADEDNGKLMEEVVDWKLSGVIKKIQDLYTDRNSTVGNLTKEWKERLPMEKMRFEIINFAMFLRVKGEDELVRLHLLDLAVREADLEKRSLDQILENERLTHKLKTQFLPVCKDTPHTVTLSPFQKDRLKVLLVDFESLYRHSLLLEYAIRKFNEGDLMGSFFGLDRGLTLPRVAGSNVEKPLVDFAGILVLRVCTLVNKLLYEGSPDLEGWIRHLGMMVVALIPKDDIHHRQVSHNLEHTRDNLASNTSTEGYALLRPVLDEVISNLIAFKLAETVNRSQIPEDLQEVIRKVESFVGNVWLEGWKPEELAVRLVHTSGGLMSKQHEIWLEMHSRMTKFKTLISDTARLDFEKKVGVAPKPRS